MFYKSSSCVFYCVIAISLCDLVAMLSCKYMIVIHRNTAYIYVVVTFLDIV